MSDGDFLPALLFIIYSRSRTCLGLVLYTSGNRIEGYNEEINRSIDTLEKKDTGMSVTCLYTMKSDESPKTHSFLMIKSI